MEQVTRRRFVQTVVGGEVTTSPTIAELKAAEEKATIVDALAGLPYYPYYLLAGHPESGWGFVDGGKTPEAMKISRDETEQSLGWHDQTELGATSSLCHIIVDAGGNIIR